MQFSNVDLDNITSIEPYDQNGKSLGRYYAPKRSDGNGLSFVGVKYEAAVIARVKIICGNSALGAGINDLTNGGVYDVVVVDNFLYGEPQAF